MGMLHGEELSQAYASADVFVMPSESETLGELGPSLKISYIFSIP